MTTLTNSPAAEVLQHLLADAERTNATLAERLANGTEEQVAEWTESGHNVRKFYTTTASDLHLAVPQSTGNLLYLLARARSARTIVEFGTSFGVSTIHLAAALRDTSGGSLITTEFEPNKAEATRRTLAAAGLDDLVEIREGDALDSLARDLSQPVDFVFLDGAKDMYLDVLQLLEPHLAANAVIVADNADRCPGYVDHVRTSDSYVSTSGDNEVEISVKVDAGDSRA